MRYKKPTLLVDRQKVMANMHRLLTKASRSGTPVWPHFKTHQSKAIGDWFRAAGIEGITVSSVSMARYFAAAGWKNIFIAFPVNINEIEDLSELATRVNLALLVNELVHVTALSKSLAAPVKFKIEIETGANRSGILPASTGLIEQLIHKIAASQHEFDGFYSHFGHTYGAADKAEVIDIFNRSYGQLKLLQTHFTTLNPKISLGDTPSASVLEDYEDIASIHAGNFVFYDLTQAQIGVCQENDIAIAMVTPIVSKSEERLELIVYGGGIHLSKEQLLSSEFGRPIFGKAVALDKTGWSDSFADTYVRAISQEHGVIKVSREIFDRYEIGDSIGILPVHSCMTADCMGGYQLADGQPLDHLQARTERV